MSIQADINKLVVEQKQTVKHGTAKVRPPIAAQVISLRKKSVKPTVSNGGTRSLLTEVSRTTEQHIKYDDFNVWSTAVDITTILNTVDGVGNPLVINLKLPPWAQP